MQPGMLQQAAGAAAPMPAPAPVPAPDPQQPVAEMQPPVPGPQPEPPVKEVSDASKSAAPDSELKSKMEPATAQEQQEYERAMDALHEVLYNNEELSTPIIKALRDTPNSKIDPIVKTSILIIQQLDDKLDLDEAVFAQLTGDVVERLIEISEVRYKTNYTDKEAQIATGAAWEGVIQLFDGGDQGEFDGLTRNLHPDDIAKSEKMYQELLNG